MVEQAEKIDNDPPAETGIESNDQHTETPQETPQVNSIKQQALSQGWLDKADYAGDAENWTTAASFLRQKSLQDTINGLKQSSQKAHQDFNQRLEHNNKMHQFTLEHTKKKLQAERLTAVEEADIEKFKANQSQIDDIDKQSAQMQPQNAPTAIQPEVQQWINRNAWMVTNHPTYDGAKAQIAEGLLNQIEVQQPHLNRQQQLDQLDERLGRLTDKPMYNSKRNAPSTNESPRKITTSHSKEAKNIEDLSKDEQAYWYEVGIKMHNGNFKAFLKTINDYKVGL